MLDPKRLHSVSKRFTSRSPALQRAMRGRSFQLPAQTTNARPQPQGIEIDIYFIDRCQTRTHRTWMGQP
jgi:hypothetical protein